MSKPLLQKNTRLLLIWLPVVLLACSLLFYMVLSLHAHHMEKQQLLLKQFNVWSAFRTAPVNIEKHITGEYDIDEGVAAPQIKLDEPRDTSIYYSGKKKTLPFKILTANFQFNDKGYHVTTYISSTEVSHLIIKVFITEAVILMLLLITIVILNRKGSRVLWKPFFSTMKKIKEYDITRNKSLDLPTQTDTTEFNELNKAVNELIAKTNAAYYHQKQFVENASHEMQTPLAIIRSKLELLINQPNLTEKAAYMLGDITEANDRLSQMNRTLLLLAKIENNQFPVTEEINISIMLSQIINNLKNYHDDFPSLETNITEGVSITANRSLIEILLSNLLNNAILHNLPAGKINVTLENAELIIENTGLPPATDPEELFERFKKGSHQSKSTGLGLSLVKQICHLYHYEISYKYDKGWHRLKVNWK